MAIVVYTEAEAEEVRSNGTQMYRKICSDPKCGRDYWSSARTQKYCCDECADKMKGVVRKKSKRKAQRRKEYDANKEINRTLSKAYSLGQAIADLYEIPKRCFCKELGLDGECSKDGVQLHHLGLNPFDNRPENLVYLCHSHHKRWHDLHGEVNMVNCFNEAKEDSGFADEGLEWKWAIDYTSRKVSKALEIKNE